MLDHFYVKFDNLLSLVGRFDLACIVELPPSASLSHGNISASVNTKGELTISEFGNPHTKFSRIEFIRLKHGWTQIKAFDDAVASGISAQPAFTHYIRTHKLYRYAAYGTDKADVGLFYRDKDTVVLEIGPFTYELTLPQYDIWLSLYATKTSPGTYGELLQRLQRASPEQLGQTVTICVDDEYHAASLWAADASVDSLDPGHLYLQANG